MSYDYGVSVVMATHNGSRFLRQQLLSLVTQTVLPTEIIISDDASTDDTLEIVNQFSSKSNVKFKVVRNPSPLGFRENFLRGALSARGSHVAFCDQDDIWDAKKLEICSKYLKNQNISMIAHTAMSVDSSNRKLGLFSQGIRSSGLKPPLSYDPWLTFFGFSIVFRREILDLWNIEDRFVDFITPNEMIAHDRWVMFIAQVVGQTVEIDVPLVRYRQHDNNLFGDGKRKRRVKSKMAPGGLVHYRDATAAMIRIVERLPDVTVRCFPLFDREHAISFLHRALHQIEQRESIYQTDTRLEALKRICNEVSTGTYRAVHDGRMRWRSIAKDVKFAIIRS